MPHISDLAALAGVDLADADVFVVDDVSAGITKKIRKDELAAAFGGGAAGGARYKQQTTIVSGANNYADWTAFTVTGTDPTTPSSSHCVIDADGIYVVTFSAALNGGPSGTLPAHLRVYLNITATPASQICQEAPFDSSLDAFGGACGASASFSGPLVTGDQIEAIVVHDSGANEIMNIEAGVVRIA